MGEVAADVKSGVAGPRSSEHPAARSSLVLLIALNLLTYMDRQVLAAVQHNIGDELFRGADAETRGAKMGIAGAMFLISYMCFSPVFGILGDRFSRWTLVAIGTIAGSLATGWTGLANSFTVLLLARCCVGISEAAYAPVAPTLLADLYPVERRGKVLSWFYVAIPVGSALGYVFGGLMSQYVGWRWAFYGLVVPGVIAGLVPLWFKDPRGKGGGARGGAGGGAGGGGQPITVKGRLAIYRRLAGIRSYALCVAGMTATTFAIGGIAFWMPEYIIKTRGYGDDGSVNLTLGAIVVVTGLAATLGGGWLGDRLRVRYPGSYFLVSAVPLLAGFPLFLLVLVLPLPMAWVPLTGAVFCLFFNTGPTNAIVANVTPPPVRSVAFAMSIFVIHLLGDVLSLVLIGVLKDRIGLQWSMALVGAMILVGAIPWLWGARHLAADTARIEAEFPSGAPASPPASLPPPA